MEKAKNGRSVGHSGKPVGQQAGGQGRLGTVGTGLGSVGGGQWAQGMRTDDQGTTHSLEGVSEGGVWMLVDSCGRESASDGDNPRCMPRRDAAVGDDGLLCWPVGASAGWVTTVVCMGKRVSTVGGGWWPWPCTSRLEASTHRVSPRPQPDDPVVGRFGGSPFERRREEVRLTGFPAVGY